MLTRDFDLRKLNSLTKYPSIPTYHEMGDRGALLETTVPFEEEDIIVTEKVDGTNSRIIFTPDGTDIIGSREELLHAKGDLIINPTLGIVEALKSFLLSGEVYRFLSEHGPDADEIMTMYFEVYGGKVGKAAKNYTNSRKFGFRLFDISVSPMDKMKVSLEEISSWRQNGGQSFLTENGLKVAAKILDPSTELTPRIKIDEIPPQSIEETHEWLKKQIENTGVALDGEAGKAEGLVIRSSDRKRIAKLRFEDYERHVKRAARK